MRITGEGIWGEPEDRAEAMRVLRRAVELGVDFIDTADSYGPYVSERADRARRCTPTRKDLVIATKAGLARTGPEPVAPGRPARISAPAGGDEPAPARGRAHRSLAAAPHRSQGAGRGRSARIKELQKQGKIRHIGLSRSTVEEIEAAAQVLSTVVSVQNQYNLGDRQHEDVLDYCTQAEPRLHPLVPGRGRQARRARAARSTARRRSTTRRRAARAGVAAASLAGHAADPRHVISQASGGERSRRLAQARTQ